MTRTLLAGVCPLHGQHDGHRCPACAQLADVPAIRECLHIHSQRIDQAHDAAMSVADQHTDLVAVVTQLLDAHNTTVRYAEAIERAQIADRARIRDLEDRLFRMQMELNEASALLLRLSELPMGNAAPAVTWIRPRP